MQEDRRKKDCRKDWLLLSIIGAAFLLALLNATVFLFSRSGEVFVEFSWYVPLACAILLLAVLSAAFLVLLRRDRERTCVMDQTSAELRQSRDRLILAQQAGHVGIFDWDVVTGELIWSDQLEKLFGLPPGSFECNYEGWAKRLHPDDRPKIESQFQKWVRERRRDIEFEHRFIRSDTAEVRWMAVSAQLSYLADGTPARMIGTKVDITERKQAEEALKRSKDELETRVKERTAELERKNKELQDFASIASHDLKEPLRKILAFGDLVVERSRDSLPRESLDYLQRMQLAAARMEVLLESLLAYSRVAIKEKSFKKVNLAEVVQGALSNLEIRIKETNASIEVGTLPSDVEADDDQLVQLFQNLLGNALKYHKDGESPHINVCSRFLENGGSRKNEYQIYIEDKGIGFDEKYLDKVFAPFQRLHERGRYEGVGMGLAICRKIIEQHKGSITARSTPGIGSTFIITLPAKQGYESELQRMPSS